MRDAQLKELFVMFAVEPTIVVLTLDVIGDPAIGVAVKLVIVAAEAVKAPSNVKLNTVETRMMYGSPSGL